MEFFLLFFLHLIMTYIAKCSCLRVSNQKMNKTKTEVSPLSLQFVLIRLLSLLSEALLL